MPASNLVMQYITPPVPNNQPTDPVAGFAPCYDIAGNLLFQHSMDAGDRWMLNDAAGKPMLAWDSRGHTFPHRLRRTASPGRLLRQGRRPARCQPGHPVRERDLRRYARQRPDRMRRRTQLNLRGKPYKHHDTAGLVTAWDATRSPARTKPSISRAICCAARANWSSDYKSTPDWSQNPALEAETFTSSTRYDALNRPIQLVAPHSDQPGAKFNVIRPGYNEANLLERVDVWLEQATEPTALLDPMRTANLHTVTNIDYDAKGQRTRIQYGNGASTHLRIRSADVPPDPPAHRPRTQFPMIGRSQPILPAAESRISATSTIPVGNITHIRDDAQQTIFFNWPKGRAVRRIRLRRDLPADHRYGPGTYRATRVTAGRRQTIRRA